MELEVWSWQRNAIKCHCSFLRKIDIGL